MKLEVRLVDMRFWLEHSLSELVFKQPVKVTDVKTSGIQGVFTIECETVDEEREDETE